MKSLLTFVALLTLLAGCNQGRRNDRDEPDPAVVTENQTARADDSLDSQLLQAQQEIAAVRYDDARITLHQIFRRQRWHPEANRLYQDLQIKRGQCDALYQEYLDLYEANKRRGDALWFHLRPLLIKRGIKACELEKHAEHSAEQQARLKEIDAEVANMKVAPEGDKGMESLRLLLIDEALEIDPMAGQRVRQRAKFAPEETLKKYREASEENPSSGDALYLFTMATIATGTSRIPGMNMLREGWILELPGAHLRTGLADLAMEMVAQFGKFDAKEATDDLLRHVRGWLELALHFYKIAALTMPGAAYEASVQGVLSDAKALGLTLEDLVQK